MNPKLKSELQIALKKNHSKVERQDPSYAVALILSERSEILLIERAKREGDHWSGQMAFPGGRSELTDTDLVATAIRETHEEVALPLSRSDVLGELLEMQLRWRGIPVPGSLHAIAFCSNESLVKTDPSEVAAAFWIPLSFFADTSNMGEYILERDGMTVRLPCLEFEGRKIWGLTYHLLAHFFKSYSLVDGKDYSHIAPLY